MMIGRTSGDDSVALKLTHRAVPSWLVVIVLLWAAVFAVPGSAVATPVSAAKGSPKEIVVRRSMGSLNFARVGEEYGLEAYVDYVGVDPRFVSWRTRLLEALKLKWSVSPDTAKVRNYAGWKFKASEPGVYVVTVEYEGVPPKTYEVTVKNEYAGTYKGSIETPAVSGVQPKMSAIEFVVDDGGGVKGSFHYGVGPLSTSGQFTGKVKVVDRFLWRKGVLEADGLQFTAADDLLTPEQRRIMAELEARGIAPEAFDEFHQKEALLKQNGGFGNETPVFDLSFKSVGYSLVAEGTLNGFPVRATAAGF